MNLEEWLPIVMLVFGWLLSEGSHFLRQRTNRKQAVRLALAELLELRHRLISNHFLFEQLEKRIKLPIAVAFQLRRSLPSPLQQDPSITERFNLAVTEVAKNDPFLAYQLRGKDIVNMIEKMIRPEAVEDDQFAEFVEETNKNVFKEIFPVLNQVVISTARHAGLIEWVKAIYLVKFKPTVNKEVVSSTDRFLKSFVEQLAAVQNSGKT